MKFKIIALFVVFCIIITGCNKSVAPSSSSEGESSQTSTEESKSNPEAALDEIYENVDIMGVEEANWEYVEEIIGLSQEDYLNYYIRKTDGRFGVADVYIIEPTDMQSETVQKALINFRDKRVAETKDYNIYNAYEIAQDAEIFQRGKYVIMVMLKDREQAVEIIQKHIPPAR